MSLLATGGNMRFERAKVHRDRYVREARESAAVSISENEKHEQQFYADDF